MKSTRTFYLNEYPTGCLWAETCSFVPSYSWFGLPRPSDGSGGDHEAAGHGAGRGDAQQHPHVRRGHCSVSHGPRSAAEAPGHHWHNHRRRGNSHRGRHAATNRCDCLGSNFIRLIFKKTKKNLQQPNFGQQLNFSVQVCFVRVHWRFYLSLSPSVPGCIPDVGYPHTLPPVPAETSYDEDWEVFDPWVSSEINQV